MRASIVDKEQDFIEGFRLELKHGLASVFTELLCLRQHFDHRLDQTNSRLDETNARLDGTNARLDETNTRLDETNTRLDETNTRLDVTNARLDQTSDRIETGFAQTNARIDQTNAELSTLQIVMNWRFDFAHRRLEDLGEDITNNFEAITSLLMAHTRGLSNLEDLVNEIHLRVHDLEQWRRGI